MQLIRNFFFSVWFFSLVFLVMGCSKQGAVSGSKLYSTEIREGENRAKEILSHVKLYDNKESIEKIEKVAKRLIKVVEQEYDTTQYQWRFYIVDEKWRANAFCLPGGKIFIFRGLFPYLSNEDELAVVLSHEMIHALKHHQRYRKETKVLSKIGKAVLSTIVFLNPYSLPFVKEQEEKKTDNLVDEYLFLPYIKSHEYEADILGLKLMQKAGYNAKSALSFWSKFSEESRSKPEYLSTHPSTKHRMEKINDFLKREH